MKIFRAIVVLPIKFYQKWISPGLAPRCKYYPSCSQYAVDAISSYGLRGALMAIWRVVRCNPWSHGGVDYAVVQTPAQIQKSSTTLKGAI